MSNGKTLRSTAKLRNKRLMGASDRIRYDCRRVIIAKMSARTANERQARPTASAAEAFGRLEKSLAPLLELETFDQADRTRCSKIMCSVAFEHAESAKLLIAAGNFTSALSVVRLQYEALVRRCGCCTRRRDRAVEKLTSELTHESSKKADRLPLLGRMLQELDGKGRRSPCVCCSISRNIPGNPQFVCAWRHPRGASAQQRLSTAVAGAGDPRLQRRLHDGWNAAGHPLWERDQSARILQTQVDFGDCLPPRNPGKPDPSGQRPVSAAFTWVSTIVGERLHRPQLFLEAMQANRDGVSADP